MKLKALLLLAMAVVMVGGVAVQVAQAADEPLSVGAYFRIPGTQIEFTYPLASASAIALYDLWRGVGLMGAETKLVTWHNFNVNFGAVTSFEANGTPFVSLDFNFGAVLANTSAFLSRVGIWYGHDFNENENHAGVKAAVPLW